MTDAPTEGGNNNDGATPPADEFKAITSQDDLNKVINDRLTRERAKFADYKDLKAKADKFDQAQQANQTEAEKTAQRIADLETELNSQRADATRLKVAAAHGITDAEDIDLFLTGTDEETLTKQAKRLADRVADRKKKGNRVPREGQHSDPPKGEELKEFAKGLFGTGT